jgi:hypothetical protein
MLAAPGVTDPNSMGALANSRGLTSELAAIQELTPDSFLLDRCVLTQYRRPASGHRTSGYRCSVSREVKK